MTLRTRSRRRRRKFSGRKFWGRKFWGKNTSKHILPSFWAVQTVWLGGSQGQFSGFWFWTPNLIFFLIFLSTGTHSEGWAPLCFLFSVFCFPLPPTALEAPGPPLNERSKTLRQSDLALPLSSLVPRPPLHLRGDPTFSRGRRATQL